MERTIFVFDTLELGGAERQGLLLAKHLRERGSHVQIWGLTGEPGPLAALCDDAAIPWRAVRIDWGTRLVEAHINAFELRRLAAGLREQQPTLLMPYTFFSNVTTGLVWRLTGAHLCVWNQRDAGFYLDGFNPWRSAAARLVPRFIANSQAGKDALVRAFAAPDRVAVIHNGVDLAPPKLSRAEWRAKLGARESTFVAAMVSNIHGNKDHVELIAAWRHVVARRPDSLLVLAGRKEETASDAEELVRGLRMTDHVRFTGHIDDVSGLWRAADLCAHCSLTEGLPNAVLEAMACGLPVVGTDIPGMREALGSDAVRYLVPRGGAQRLAELITELASDPDLRRRVGGGLQHRVQREFSAEAMCRATVDQLMAW
ncbi:MAG TPA: glycosyltransferase [Kofleriaceae bacterium]|jgi:glycosyltransferase involved in cell wall biosynthesis|nr:glycosyltransferase [Kofleriaceae bacterium]